MRFEPSGWMPGLLLSSALVACASAGSGHEPRPRFVFRSGFWVNMHHLLRAEARRRERGAELVQPLAELGPEAREAWVRALDVHRPLARRSLLFDEGMTRIHVALSAADGEGGLPVLEDAELGAALEGAAPVFRERRWPARARANEDWVQRTRPAVERLAAEVTDAMAAALELTWPEDPILVDVTPLGHATSGGARQGGPGGPVPAARRLLRGRLLRRRRGGPRAR